MKYTFLFLRNYVLKKQRLNVRERNHQNFRIIDGVNLTKYKGKFFEIDLPKLIGKFLSKKHNKVK